MKVRVYELSKPARLRPVEAGINRELASRFASGLGVVLFQDQRGEVGYSVRGVPVEGGRAVLDQVHRTVRKLLRRRRGRPVSEPKHQVKVWISEAKYRELARAALRRSVSPSSLAGELVVSQLP